MKIDLHDAGDLESMSADIVVIGAGAVGLVTAVSLARAGKRVILVESGGERFEQASQDLNLAAVVGRPHTGIHEGRARVVGGTTSLWGGQLFPFTAIDFEERPWLGLKRWPITKEDLAPYYAAAGDLLGLDQRIHKDDEVWSAIRLETPQLGSAFEVILTRWLRETNFARYFAEDLRSRPGLTLLYHATATHFGLSATGSTVETLTVASMRGRKVSIAAKAFVIACGTIEAARLLLNAARNEPRAPWSSNHNIGIGFQDHLDIRAARVFPNRKNFGDTFDNIFLGGYKYNPKVHLSDVVQREQQLLNIAATFVFDSSFSEHLANVKLFVRTLRRGAVPENVSKLPSHIMALRRILWPLVWRYLREHRAFNPSDLGVHLVLHCEQLPIPQSTISLDETRSDALGMPLARLDWQVAGVAEVDTMARFCEMISAALAEKDLARLEVDPRILARDHSILKDARDTNHQAGGLRMGTDETEGVVSGDLRVFGTTNLFVTGAATFPTSSFANPTFTAIALSLRLVDQLRNFGSRR